MTTNPTATPLWQRLVQWQPADAALIVAHCRALPDDWPLRVFGVGRPEAAMLLPPAATGEQFPNRIPEIAPYDEIAALDDCPACEEAGGNCRFHEGYAAGYHEMSEAQREAVKARPDIMLRDFMHWQADVAEAEDRGEEPPPLPAAAPSPDRVDLRQPIADALREHGMVHLGEQVPADEYDCCADAVLKVLPSAAVPPPTDRAAVYREIADRQTQLAVSDDLARRRDLAAARRQLVRELRRVAAEAQQEMAPAVLDLTDGPVHCPLCPHPVTLHTPNGARAHFTTVHPEQRITGRGPGPWPLLVTDDTVHACPGRWGGPDCRCFDTEPAGAQQQPDTETPTPRIGEKWRSKHVNRIVTVNRVWEHELEPGRIGVAYQWRDDNLPGLCGSACGLDMFHELYEPAAGQPAADTTQEQT